MYKSIKTLLTTKSEIWYTLLYLFPYGNSIEERREKNKLEWSLTENKRVLQPMSNKFYTFLIKTVIKIHEYLL